MNLGHFKSSSLMDSSAVWLDPAQTNIEMFSIVTFIKTLHISHSESPSLAVIIIIFVKTHGVSKWYLSCETPIPIFNIQA